MSSSSVSSPPGDGAPLTHVVDAKAPDCLPLRAEAPSREFEDATGVEWTVREVDARGVPGAQGDCYLLFQSRAIWRRVWDYPSDWLTLPVPALEALGAQR